MTNQNRDLAGLARKVHENLPDRIREYLDGRGIPDEMIDLNLLGWNGWRITIPILGDNGKVAFFKQAKDPEDKSDSPKMIAWPKGHLELYGWENLTSGASQIVICEGEFDRLVLEANGFKAVTSTGGARAFRKEWAKEFESIQNVYICFDNDEAGKNGALRVGRFIPHAKIVELPNDVGDGGDVTDFFVRLGRSREDLANATSERLWERFRNSFKLLAALPNQWGNFDEQSLRIFCRLENIPKRETQEVINALCKIKFADISRRKY